MRPAANQKKPGVFVDEGMSYSGRMCSASVLLRAKRGARLTLLHVMLY